MAVAVEVPAAQTRSAAAVSWFDWMLIIGGGLPLVVPLVFFVGEQRLSGNDPIQWYIWVSALFSSPHVYSTYARLGRKIGERRVSPWLGLPLYFGWVALLMATFTLDQSYSMGAFVTTITAVNVWQSFHYLRQTYGVGRFYQREYGQLQSAASGAGLMFWAYHLIMPALIIGRWDTLYDAWNGATYGNIVPINFSGPVMLGLWLVAGTGVVLAVVAEWRNWLAMQSRYMPIGIVNFLICLGVHAFGFCSVEYFYRGFIAVTVFHGVQYLALVWKLEKQHAGRQQKSIYQKLPFFGGFLLFWTFMILLGLSYEYGFATHLIGNIQAGSYAPYVAALVISLLLGVSAHHYTVDMFLWRRGAGA